MLHTKLLIFGLFSHNARVVQSVLMAEEGKEKQGSLETAVGNDGAGIMISKVCIMPFYFKFVFSKVSCDSHFCQSKRLFQAFFTIGPKLNDGAYLWIVKVPR